MGRATHARKLVWMMSMQSLTLEDAENGTWDVIVIGAGLGGGVLGRRLTEHGLSVLFLEKGPLGNLAERVVKFRGTHPAARLMRGLWPKLSEARMNGVSTRFHGPYGSGVGGSSAFYAGALERPERHDLDDDPACPHPTGGWPVDYDTFLPYFEAVRRQFRVGGEPDPLASDPETGLAPPMAVPAGDTALMEEMRQRGLHPYRQHLAFSKPDKCRECMGSKCPWGCKMDGRSAGVLPALESGRAALLDMCEVAEVIDDGERVRGLRVMREGRETVLAGKTYALCGGSFGSARLLLASNRRRPEGCANSSGWVGRGLMFHLDEYFVLWPRGKKADGAAQFGRSISLRDLYREGSRRFGLVQSLGLGASYGNIVSYFEQLFDQSPLRRFQRLKTFTRLPALVVSRVFGNAAIFTGLIEDFPYWENRVVLNETDPEILTFEYRYHDELLKRRKRYRKLLRRAFRGHKRFMVSLRPVLNFGHPLGTLRFGHDPATSVLRPDCRTHDLDNLYVVDGSFMPSALGVNPSLTIAANALRVADLMADRMADRMGDLGPRGEDGEKRSENDTLQHP